MRVKIMMLVGREWSNVPMEKIEGKSICDFLLEHHGRCVVAVYHGDDKKPCVFFVNKTQDLDAYTKRGDKVFHAQDVAEFLGAPVKASLYMEVFGEGEFIHVGKIDEQLKLDGQ